MDTYPRISLKYINILYVSDPEHLYFGVFKIHRCKLRNEIPHFILYHQTREIDYKRLWAKQYICYNHKNEEKYRKRENREKIKNHIVFK